MEIILGFIAFIFVMLFLVKGSDKQNKSNSATTNSHPQSTIRTTYSSNQHTPKYQRRGDPLWFGERKLIITYKDLDGNVTNRSIRIRQVYPMDSGEIYFQADCELREESRTFKAEGVLELITARRKKYTSFYEYMSEELKI